MGKKSPVSHKASRGNKIKLVQIIAEKDAVGGGPKHVLGILNNIDQSRFDLFLICPAGELSQEAKKIKGVEVFNSAMKSKFNLLAVLAVKKFLSEIQARGNPFGPMIVHTHGPRAGLLGRQALKPGMLSVYTEHIWGPGYHLDNRINEALQKKVLKKLNFKTNLVIAVSAAVKKYLIEEKMAPEERTVVIPNGITMSNVKYQMSNIKNLSRNNKQIVGTVGSLNKMKGQKYLIQAFLSVTKVFPHSMLEIVGEGEERANLKSQISNLKLERHVTLLGRRKDVEKIIQKWSIFVLPSLAETFGISILEAYNANLPVIASAVGGIKDIVQDKKSGILVKPEQPLALAKAIIELLSHPALAAKIARGGKKRAEDFDWKKVIGQLEKAYLKIIK